MNKIMNEKNVRYNNNLNDIELFRSLRTRIQLTKENIKLISVVSNDANDGKTQVAFSLAKSYTKAGKKVLLVDGNLRNPELSSKVDSKGSSGLSQLLKGKGEIQNLIIKTHYDYLYLLPTGEAESESTELLEEILLSEIFEEVRNLFDVVIVDTPAMNIGMDALLLSKHCDGVIYVTVETKTNRNKLKENKMLFDEAGIDIVGVVFRGDTI